MALNEEMIEALAHRFADELIYFTRTGESKDPAVMESIERLVEGKLEKVIKVLLKEGFVMNDPTTWARWENDWVIQCKKAREADKPKIVLG